jgi:hypothetical protein
MVIFDLRGKETTKVIVELTSLFLVDVYVA